jgi:hypothetical protein
MPTRYHEFFYKNICIIFLMLGNIFKVGEFRIASLGSTWLKRLLPIPTPRSLGVTLYLEFSLSALRGYIFNPGNVKFWT